MTLRDTEKNCVSCRSPKVSHSCPLCEESVCSKCVMRPPQGAFLYQVNCESDLKHPAYCQGCFAERVEPALEQYEETLAKARDVFVFFVTQRKEIPLIRKSKELLMVQEQDDRDMTILKLAYLGAERGFNAIIQCDVVSTKVRNEGYQRSVWNGKAYPAEVDAEKLDRYGF